MGIAKIYTYGVTSSTSNNGSSIPDDKLITSITIADNSEDGGNDTIIITYKDDHTDVLELNANGKIKLHNDSELTYLEDIIDTTTLSIVNDKLQCINDPSTANLVTKLELVNNSIQLTYEDGHTDTVDVVVSETVTNLTYDSDTYTLTYTNEANEVVTKDLTQARITEGNLDNNTLKLTRNDNSTLEIDLSTIVHTHANKEILDKISYDENEGKLTYNGNAIDTTIAQRDVYHGVDSTSTTVSLSAGTGKIINDKVESNIEAIGLNTTHRNNKSNPHEVKAEQIPLDTTNFTSNLDNTVTDIQKLAETVDTLTMGSDVIFYTENGTIEDKNHTAIFKSGVTEMTIPEITVGREIRVSKTHNDSLTITASNNEQFEGRTGVSTDSKLNLNKSYTTATLIGSNNWLVIT